MLMATRIIIRPSGVLCCLTVSIFICNPRTINYIICEHFEEVSSCTSLSDLGSVGHSVLSNFATHNSDFFFHWPYETF